VKVFVKKRKVFDIKAHRQAEVEDDDMNNYKKPVSKVPPKKNISKVDEPIKAGSKAAKWKA
jgi:hypothetical protein